ncbi:hypothetical protein AVDCRST_MAG92-3290 [uncultured Coleofasciculus sp.]|uniref:Uncharacterized protein n=1 Tax=uncultured Coleofasciculus sp. TaxID=1267456 RepID=A0A6J4JDD3_9CYAN|nr:hypothetical protein AVDCRST_MAG92-3290 [uncultured Coleofasciculus sp.]
MAESSQEKCCLCSKLSPEVAGIHMGFVAKIGVVLQKPSQTLPIGL